MDALATFAAKQSVCVEELNVAFAPVPGLLGCPSSQRRRGAERAMRVRIAPCAQLRPTPHPCPSPMARGVITTGALAFPIDRAADEPPFADPAGFLVRPFAFVDDHRARIVADRTDCSHVEMWKFSRCALEAVTHLRAGTP